MADKITLSFGEEPPTPPPAAADLGWLFAAAIAITDLALIGYYLVTNPPKT